MLAPDPRQHRRCQAEKPVIRSSEFPEPPLSPDPRQLRRCQAGNLVIDLSEFPEPSLWQGRGAQGLAEDVRYYGAWMREEAARRIGHLYPEATLPDGSKATVIAWLWARTVHSPDPAAKGAMVPLVSSFMLSTKDGKKAWVKQVMDEAAPDGWKFEVKTGSISKEDETRLTKGTVGRSGGGTCILTGAPMPFKYLREEASAERFNVRLMAIVAEGRKGRTYLSAEIIHENVARVGRPDSPEGEISHWPGRTNVVEYGMRTFSSLFRPRQLISLNIFSDLVAEARQKALADTRSAGLIDDELSLAKSGMGATA